MKLTYASMTPTATSRNALVTKGMLEALERAVLNHGPYRSYYLKKTRIESKARVLRFCWEKLHWRPSIDGTRVINVKHNERLSVTIRAVGRQRNAHVAAWRRRNVDILKLNRAHYLLKAFLLRNGYVPFDRIKK